MTTNSENTHSIGFPLADVHAALSSQEYWEYEAKNIGDEPGEVRNFTGGPNVKAELAEKLPIDAVPESFRAMVPATLELARTVTLGPVEGGRATGTVTAEVSGLPVKFNADLVLQDADGATSLSAKSAVDVKIPMMGSMLEPKIMEWVEQFIAHESSLIEKYLKENA
ncbi:MULTISPECIES: DUF2505 domain-containing protein [Corynebacterium]|uniref:DUF2505 domain-containing protein n=1 Tax=Corynebacterium urealyticum TaxID=43771 RepID=A0A5D4FX89_9CORY|nr:MULTISPECIES: DUF2505 domain-containing protein [Corynebacterium]MDK7134586.1 DUF2505 domain-containing protein [Corynebacterium sp. UMB4614]TYR19865.1 DUF2505 domain-containing protein [Corynebacterium urealyticum]